jgi:asparagine synthase (glutamine-hydrolysing)
MCGINGIFSTNSISDSSLIQRMNGRIVHRGPDDEGVYASGNLVMGMRRLSIIDPAEGHQPIFNEDNRFVIVFNGEIYNYRELRQALLRRGHVFKTKTDTEVVLHLYEEKKERCLEDLNGMFAIAIFDSKREEIFLARDRVGKKPLYYSVTDNFFIFASELKSILEAFPRKRRLSAAAIEQFFAFTFIPAPLTIFQIGSRIVFNRVKESFHKKGKILEFARYR